MPRRTAADKVLCHKAFSIAKYDGYSSELTLIVYNFFDKKSSCSRVKSEIMPN